jgi:ATP-dependent RNA helicase RhlE
VSLVAAEEHELLRAIERLIGNPLPKAAVPGFEPTVLSAPPLDLSGGRGRRPQSGGGGGGGRGSSGRPGAPGRSGASSRDGSSARRRSRP